MKALISLMLVTSLAGAQEVRAPQRGEERREPNRVERPEPVRVQPQPESPRQEQPPRRAEPRPELPLDRPVPPMGRPGGVVIIDPWVRNRGDCWNRMDCGINPWIMMQMDMSRRNHTMDRRRPNRTQLTERQQRQLRALREEFIRKRNRILNNP